MTVRAVRRLDTTFQSDVVAGLSRTPKILLSKYFYDAAGSQLFDRITNLTEYYPTRTEVGILQAHADSIAARCGPGCLLVELGAGSLTKARLLLDRLDRPAGYIPIDVSGDHLHAANRLLADDYPDLKVRTVVADFTDCFEIPSIAAQRLVAFFPGSTLGNFDPPVADSLLRNIAGLIGPDGGLILGVDLRKQRSVMELAYNDTAGVTTAFNKNLLVRINRELGADFDPDAFRHNAFYNDSLSRIEMHLVSIRQQRVRVADWSFSFHPGESIHTENSYKYDLDDLTSRASHCGLSTDQIWIDDRRYFAVLYFTACRTERKRMP